ncbi:MAG: hypothetical protein RR454_03045 [Clostridia bacterium]
MYTKTKRIFLRIIIIIFPILGWVLAVKTQNNDVDLASLYNQYAIVGFSIYLVVALILAFVYI